MMNPDPKAETYRQPKPGPRQLPSPAGAYRQAALGNHIQTCGEYA